MNELLAREKEKRKDMLQLYGIGRSITMEFFQGLLNSNSAAPAAPRAPFLGKFGNLVMM